MKKKANIPPKKSKTPLSPKNKSGKRERTNDQPGENEKESTPPLEVPPMTPEKDPYPSNPSANHERLDIDEEGSEIGGTRTDDKHSGEQGSTGDVKSED